MSPPRSSLCSRNSRRTWVTAKLWIIRTNQIKDSLCLCQPMNKSFKHARSEMAKSAFTSIKQNNLEDKWQIIPIGIYGWYTHVHSHFLSGCNYKVKFQDQRMWTIIQKLRIGGGWSTKGCCLWTITLLSVRGMVCSLRSVSFIRHVLVCPLACNV